MDEPMQGRLNTPSRGKWYQELPKEHPNVPTTDKAIQVQVKPGPPKAKKVHRIAPAIHQRTRNPLIWEVKSGSLGTVQFSITIKWEQWQINQRVL